MMLQKIKRYLAAIIQSHDFPVNKCIGREALAGLSDMWELVCKVIFASRPESHALFISPSQAPVAVELNLIEPFRALGQALNQPGIHRLDEPDFGARQRAEGFGFHAESKQVVRLVQ